MRTAAHGAGTAAVLAREFERLDAERDWTITVDSPRAAGAQHRLIVGDDS